MSDTGGVSPYLAAAAICLLAPLGPLVAGDDGGALVMLVVCIPTALVTTAVIALEWPIRRWLHRRHARIVAEGVARLEAKVAASERSSQAPTTPCIVPLPRRPRRDLRGPAVARRPRPTLLFDSQRFRATAANDDDPT